MEVHATLRRLRIAPRKVRLVVDLIRGLSVQEAEVRLAFLQKDSALPVLKLLKSAKANAEHNFKLDASKLVVSEITANDGPTIKRFMPRAFGRAGTIRKRSTHIYMTLAPADTKAKVGKKKAKKIAAAKKHPVQSDTAEPVKAKKPAVKKGQVKT